MTSVPSWVAAAAIAVQICYPLVSGTPRDVLTVAIVLLLAAASILHAIAIRGCSWAVMLIAVTAGIGLCAEVVGTATGYPFGSYTYAAGRLGPDIWGVPAIVPFAWTAGFYPILCAAAYVTAAMPPSRRRTLARLVTTATAMVGWDLYLDPQMVSDGLWNWHDHTNGLPGISAIPITNFLGWFAVAAVMAALMASAGDGRPRVRFSDGVPLSLFMWTWLGSAVAHAVFLPTPELRYSALYGGAAMGVLGVPLLRTLVVNKLRTRHAMAPSVQD